MAVPNINALESQLSGLKLSDFTGISMGERIGASNFAVVRGKLGMERLAVKMIPYRDQNYPREAAIKEIHALNVCSGGRNILSLIGWQEDEELGIICIAMEFCDSGTLSRWIRFDPPKTLDQKFEMFKGIVAGISFIHIREFIHNDIKPDNILISDGVPMIADFGSTSFVGETIVGTKGYKCPESTFADEISDAYSLGVTVHQLYSQQFRIPDDPYGFEYSAIQDSLIREVLAKLLVPRADRISVKRIINVFPQTSGPAESIASLITDSTSTTRQNMPSGSRGNTSNFLASPGLPSKLARFPSIRSFWGENIRRSDEPVPMKEFLDNIKLVVSRETRMLFLNESEDFKYFVRSVATDENAPEQVSPLSLALMLSNHPGTETDALESALIRIFQAIPQERFERSRRAELQSLWVKAQSGDEKACVLVAGPVAVGAGGLSKNVAQAASLLSFGLGQPRIVVSHFIEQVSDQWKWNGSTWDNFKTTPISVDLFGNITSIVLMNQGLEGSIPEALCELENLTYLDLASNQLKGSIPKQLGKLRRLRYLLLWGNQLSGEIPAELCQLEQLQSLSLRSNQTLQGRIPKELGQLKQIQEIYLRNNELSGIIPPELGQMTHLQFLSVRDNKITGSIPIELIDLKHILKIDLSHNQLSGEIPPQIGQISQLEYLSLAHNQLTGKIPKELGQLVRLKTLNLSSNRLSGSIPTEVKCLKCDKDFSNNTFSNTLLKHRTSFITSWLGNKQS